MAYPYAVQRHRELQGWVPSVDIDGIDAKETLLADMENVDLHNGFFCNAVKPVELPYDSVIAAAIANGYEVLSMRYFYNKDRGDCDFYLLYKFSTIHELRYFIKDSTTIVELNIDEQSSDIDISEKPTNINYAYVGGQLKVNLNITANYLGISKHIIGKAITYNPDVYLNLSLSYISGAVALYNSISRNDGWYLFPRWLGWSYEGEGYNFSGGLANTTLTFEGAIDTGNQGETITGFGGVVVDATSSHSGTSSLKYDPSSSGNYARLYIENIQPIRKISFYVRGAGLTSAAEIYIKVGDSAAYGDSDEIFTHTIDASAMTSSWEKHTIVFNKTYNPMSLVIGALGGTGDIIRIDDLILHYEWDGGYCLVGVTNENQRGLIYWGETIRIGGDFSINDESIDWRFIKYELYLRGEGLFYLVNEYEVSSTDWVVAGTVYSQPILNSDFDMGTSITLNFNYGLNYTVLAYNIEANTIHGIQISKEISYRHRQYFVNEDEKLYMSHIAGSGLTQLDSFPYNEDVTFGYLITEENERNLALAVTPLDEMIILGENKSYVYYMQIVNSTVVRKIKAINGSVGILSAKTLAVDNSGYSSGMNLFWIDKQGCYLYAGGREEPKSVSNNTHRNYWLEILTQANKEAGLLAYNRMKREYWFQVGTDIIIYEEMYGRFKKYKFDFIIKEFLGTRSDKFYMLAEDGKVYVIDYTSSERLDAMIQTHPSTNTIIIGQYPISSWEWQHKILQDLYIAIKGKYIGFLNYTLILDEVELDNIKFSTDSLRSVVPSPLLVRYGKIAIRLNTPATLSKVKEFGYSFSVPSQGVGNLQVDSIGGIGQSVGTSLGINQ